MSTVTNISRLEAFSSLAMDSSNMNTISSRNMIKAMMLVLVLLLSLFVADVSSSVAAASPMVGGRVVTVPSIGVTRVKTIKNPNNSKKASSPATPFVSESAVLELRGGGDVSFLRKDGRKSSVTGLPLLAAWMYPPIEFVFVVMYWIFTLKFFTNEARAFWTYMSIAHMMLIAVTNYGISNGLRWNLPLVPVKVMVYFDLFLTICSAIHPLMYPDGYGSLFWIMVVGIPAGLPMLFSIDKDPYSCKIK